MKKTLFFFGILLAVFSLSVIYKYWEYHQFIHRPSPVDLRVLSLWYLGMELPTNNHYEIIAITSAALLFLLGSLICIRVAYDAWTRAREMRAPSGSKSKTTMN